MTDETPIMIDERDNTLPDQWEVHANTGKDWRRTHTNPMSKTDALKHARELKTKNSNYNLRVKQVGAAHEDTEGEVLPFVSENEIATNEAIAALIHEKVFK